MWVFNVVTDGENEVKSENCKNLFGGIQDMWVKRHHCVYSLLSMSIIIIILLYLNTCCILGYDKITIKTRKIISLNSEYDLPLCKILLYVIVCMYITIINFICFALYSFSNEINEFEIW